MRILASVPGMAVLRVPFTGDEKQSLRVALDRHRDVVLWKLEGLDDEPLRRPMTASGTSLLGLVKHLAAVEYGWFCQTFDRPTEPLPFDEDDADADLRPRPEETVADIVAFYARARAAADQVIDEHDIDRPRHRLVRGPGDAALGAHPHGRGDRPARRSHGHPARARRRAHR